MTAHRFLFYKSHAQFVYFVTKRNDNSGMDEKKILKNFGQKLKKAREKARLTQAELAEKVGFSPNFIGMVERGERNTKFSNVYKIIHALDSNMEDFFKGF